MKRDSRTTVFLWLAVLLLVLMAACSSSNNENSTESLTNENERSSGEGEPNATGSDDPGVPEINLTYWTNLNNNVASSLQSLSEVEMYKEMEKDTNVKLQFQHPPAGQANQQFNLIMSSRDFADVMEGNWNQYAGGPTKAIEDGVLVPLNDLIEQHAPNFKKVLEDYPQVMGQISTTNGEIYAFPSINVGRYRTFSGNFIRQDWLDELGLNMPETIADWEQVLQTFKEEKGVEAPFSTNLFFLQNIPSFIEAYGVTHDFFVEDGEVRFGPIESGMKQALETMNKWYVEGWLDKDFATNDRKAIDAKLLNDQAGAVPGYIGGSMGSYYVAKADDPTFNLVAAPFPVYEKGEQPRFVPFNFEVSINGQAGITTANEHPVETVRWFDYFYGEEGHMLKNFGVEGVTYEIVDGYPTYTDLIMNNSNGYDIAQSMARYFRANYPTPGMDDDRYLEQYYTLPQQQDAMSVFSEHSDYSRAYRLPPVNHTVEESSELAQIMSDVKTYREEMLLKFIYGDESLDQFDAYVEQINRMGIGRALEMMQTAYDRYTSN
ncbi:extracellular solute-binding protein [Paenibacillus sp. IB182496]|uniref:Extracellular solute-binding protein n=2 Tax=Paenibacillus sabuli TaxID=2772509 RepID=A0A927GPK7_9BACL|nr:extracellular solute-binding protein [Paenibacillus sabuli]